MRYLLIAALFLMVCDDPNNGNEVVWSVMEATDFSLVTKTGLTANFEMTVDCGSACWIDFRDNVTPADSNQYLIQSIARSDLPVCTQQCQPYTRQYEITVPSSGSYTFKYLNSDSVFVSIPLFFTN